MCDKLNNDECRDENELNSEIVNNVSSKNDDTKPQSATTSCGWFNYRPKIMQKYATPRWLLLWLCLAGALQGFIVNGCVNVVITTIERRYKMKSTESGLIAGGYDVGAFLFLAPISYFGAHRSKPAFISIGIIIMAFGALVFSLPYFTAGIYEFSRELETTCRNSTVDVSWCTTDEHNSKLSNYKWVFFLGQFLHGVGATPLYTLGCTLLDESVPTKQSSLYLGIYYSMTVLGPGLGYMLGGQILNWLYVDWIYVNADEVGLTFSSPVWVGAWYIVFIIGFSIGIFIAFPISAYPIELPGTAEIRAKKVSEMHKKLENSAAVKNKQFGQKAKDFPKSLRILLTNPTFMFLNLAGASEGMLVSAFATFLPKVVEQQFSVSTSAAALIVGLVSIPGAGGGTFIGGYIVKRFDLKCSSIIKWCIFCALVSFFLTMAFFITCPNIHFAGVTDPYPNQQLTNELSIDSACNANCGANACSVYEYDPVCGANNQMFYSPCHAGCRSVHQFANSKVYTDCECLQHLNESNKLSNKYLKQLGGNSLEIEAIREKCDTECTLLLPFLIMIFLCMLFTFFISMPSLSATLRCVADSQKSFALGIQWMLVRILGTIPAPLIFGKLIDLSCILWQKTCDNSSGACFLYDNKQMSRNLLSIAISLKALTLIFLFFACFLYKPVTTDDETNNISDANNIKIDLSDDRSNVSQCCGDYKSNNAITKL